MELREAIMTRRSVRKYKDTPIPRETLEELMEVACWAPSGMNRQPWYFVVLTEEKEIQRFQEQMNGVSEKLRPTLEGTFPNHPEVVQETVHFLRSLGGAPVYVLAFMQQDYKRGPSMGYSIAAAIQNLLLTAHEKGIASCWITAPVETGYGEVLRQMYAPDKGEFISLITLGYADIEPKAPPRKPGRYTIL